MIDVITKLILFILVAVLCACATPQKTEEVSYANPMPEAEKKYSSTPNYINAPERKYKRTTRESLSRDAKLQQEAGSLWVMQGQGSYLFAQNNLRMIGDLVSIDIDGEPKKELEQKVETIAYLLKRLEQRRIDFEKKQSERRMAMMNEREEVENAGREPANKIADKKGETEEEKNKLEDFKFAIKKVATRIKERLFNGNYRVEGSKGFLIGDKEYRVIITGVARAEDIMGEAVNSSKLIEANFDIVSTLREGKSL